MSYNTRRNIGGTGARGGTTQVNYHQQSRVASSNQAPPARNPGYTTSQPSSYNTQPAYSAQTGYSTSTAPVTQPKPVQQQPQTTPAKPPATPAPAPTPTLKQEPVTPSDTPKMDTSENGEGAAKVPFWKKKPYLKVSNKVKKARQNAKLRRILNPKNALTFLNELKPGAGKFVVREDPGWGFIATVEVDGKKFTGHALSSSKAKVQASEHALKYLLMEQMTKAQTEAIKKEATKDAEGDEESMETEPTEEGGEPKPKKAKETPEDELPWGSLAAFALHKLFSEWQKEGQEDPEEKYEEAIEEESFFTRRPGPPSEYGYPGPRRFGPGPGFSGRGGRGFAPYPMRGHPHQGFGIARRPPPSIASTFLADRAPPLGSLRGLMEAKPMKKIPEDATKRHPVMLLNQLKPTVVYCESRQGEIPNVFYFITVEIDGKEYHGQGKSKKEAKFKAAKAALVSLGVTYPEESDEKK